VLSGPEPQRSILEARLLEQAMLLPHKFIFVQGKTQAKTHHFVAENVEQVSYLTSAELNQVLAASHRLVCRAGYSSIMDLAAIGKKAILIPTPGQTEQEYLADYLGEKKLFLTQSQDNLDLESGLKALRDTTGFNTEPVRMDGFEAVLEEWLG
jgi:UDP-N-acetylglucosamine:LPS N-acetylglucosamine transferase